MALLNCSSKMTATFAASCSLISYSATAVVSAASCSRYECTYVSESVSLSVCLSVSQSVDESVSQSVSESVSQLALLLYLAPFYHVLHLF